MNLLSPADRATISRFIMSLPDRRIVTPDAGGTEHQLFVNQWGMWCWGVTGQGRVAGLYHTADSFDQALDGFLKAVDPPRDAVVVLDGREKGKKGRHVSTTDWNQLVIDVEVDGVVERCVFNDSEVRFLNRAAEKDKPRTSAFPH